MTNPPDSLTPAAINARYLGELFAAPCGGLAIRGYRGLRDRGLHWPNGGRHPCPHGS